MMDKALVVGAGVSVRPRVRRHRLERRPQLVVLRVSDQWLLSLRLQSEQFYHMACGRVRVGGEVHGDALQQRRIVGCGGQLTQEVQTDFTEASGPLMFYAFYVSETLQNVNSISHHRMYGCTVRRAGELLHDSSRRTHRGRSALFLRRCGDALTTVRSNVS